MTCPHTEPPSGGFLFAGMFARLSICQCDGDPNDLPGAMKTAHHTFDADRHRKYPLAAWLPNLLGPAERSSPKAASRRAKGAGLDGEGVDRAILHPGRGRHGTGSDRDGYGI